MVIYEAIMELVFSDLEHKHVYMRRYENSHQKSVSRTCFIETQPKSKALLVTRLLTRSVATNKVVEHNVSLWLFFAGV